VKIGIIGVGHLAGYLVKGLRRGGFAGTIFLSPRNRQKADGLALEAKCRVLADNQDVVDAAEVVFLTVPAAKAEEVLQALSFRPRQLVISACAGQARTKLQRHAAPARLVTAMPVSAAEIGRSPTLLYPGDPEAEEILKPLGPVLVMASEALFTAASANAAVYVWIIDLIKQLTDCNQAAGLDAAEARRLVALMVEAAASVALAEPHKPLPDLIDGLTSKGGISERGFHILRERDAHAPWAEAFDAVLDRLSGRD
jgi:pyrroline-5-carboxylate reductase